MNKKILREIQKRKHEDEEAKENGFNFAVTYFWPRQKAYFVNKPSGKDLKDAVLVYNL